MRVAKFGGSSLADAGCFGHVCDIVTADPRRHIVVVSAPGKRFKEDTKVTDLLIKCAKKRIKGKHDCAQQKLEEIIDRYQEIAGCIGCAGAADAVMAEIRSDLEGRLAADYDDTEEGRNWFIDLMKAAGEDNSARMMAVVLADRGFAARYVNPCEAGLLLSDEAGNAQVLPEAYDNLASLADSKEIVVFPGFFGCTPKGKVVTFPRGGSDITGSILAKAIKAELYENFTDVNQVRAVDPDIIKDARPIEVLTYREMRELSYFGFDVFNAEALEPVARAGIPVCIRYTAEPESPGTMLVASREAPEGEVVIGIAGAAGFTTIFVRKFGMNRIDGFVYHLLGILHEEGISYEHAPTGIDDISVIVRDDQLKDKAEYLKQRIRDGLELSEDDDVDIRPGHALIMVVGQGMREACGITARAAKALADENISIHMLNQGSSELSTMYGVEADQLKTGIQAIYRAFFGG